MFCSKGDNISELMQEIATCKEYVNTLIEINDDVAYLKEISRRAQEQLCKSRY